MRLPSAIVLAAAALLAAVTPGRAQSAYDYPWCAVYGSRDGSGAMSCYYATRELCMQTISGIGGSCVRSPYYRGPDERRPRRERRDY